MAGLATALNDPRRTTIGDPRRGQYTVTFRTGDMTEAASYEHALTAVGLNARTNHRRNEDGEAIYAFVVLYDHSDQQQLFELVKERLEPERRQALETLVLARGTVPPDIKRRINDALHLMGWSAAKTAEKMNAAGVVAGMGGHRWTGNKVKAAVADA